MQLALVLDLLLVGEDVVDEAGVVGGRVLQGRASARCGRSRRGTVVALAEPAQAHGQVRAERRAAASRGSRPGRGSGSGLVGQLPQPAVGHLLARRRGTLPRVAPPSARRCVRHRSARPRSTGLAGGGGARSERHEQRQPRRWTLRAGQVARRAEDHREVVVGVRAPGQPAACAGRARPASASGSMHRRAQREVEAASCSRVPEPPPGPVGVRMPIRAPTRRCARAPSRCGLSAQR